MATIAYQEGKMPAADAAELAAIVERLDAALDRGRTDRTERDIDRAHEIVAKALLDC
jgi:hypothetical protein